MPARRQRPGFGFSIAHHRADDEIRVIERRAVGMGQRVPELSPLVNRSGNLGRDVAGDAARKGKLAKEPSHAAGVERDIRADLAVGPFQPGVGEERGASVTRTDDIDRVQIPPADRAIHVRIDEVQPRRRSPVAEKPGLHVLGG